MKWPFILAGSAVMSVLLQGCSSALIEDSNLNEDPEAFFQPVEQEIDPIAPMVLRVIGYGAMDTDKKKSEVQRRLMAIRASKMDAYRSMAERVYGTSIQGSTTVRDMVVQNDRFRSYVETYMHGARVVSSDVMPDGSVETVLEMVIDQGFRNCLQTADSQRFNVDCRAPMGRGSESNHFASSQRQRVQGEASVPESGFYFIE
ncbi:MAG: LPP20 family lipoprotein [Saccharospirillaceae bacterium]|nr:LPP20 family lipoprotein [Saccharospirillaceae bacterium]MCD8530323.1 LPP20 family lipoprotein [Saccharospirillaceae bacterium]